jgi:hypothetical protein
MPLAAFEQIPDRLSKNRRPEIVKKQAKSDNTERWLDFRKLTCHFIPPAH